MEQQPEQQQQQPEVVEEDIFLPALSDLQAKTDDELLQLFDPDDAGKSSFYSNRLSEVQKHNESILRHFCFVGRDRDPQAFGSNIYGRSGVDWRGP